MQIQTQAQLDAQQAQGQLTMQERKAEREAALAQQRFELDRQMALLQHELATRDQQFRHLQAAVGSAGGVVGSPDGNAAAAAMVAQLMDTIRQMNAPKRVVRDAQGRVSHVEPMPISTPTGVSDGLIQ
jgi:septal ring factor EnvC (AmiA/AmiB activator)